MNKAYLLFDSAGLILQVGQCPENEVQNQTSLGKFVFPLDAPMPLVESALNYITNPLGTPKLAPRPTNPTQLAGLRLTQVPVSAKLKIENDVYNVTEPTVDLEFALPGTYTVTVEAFPYLDATFTVTV